MVKYLFYPWCNKELGAKQDNSRADKKKKLNPVRILSDHLKGGYYLTSSWLFEYSPSIVSPETDGPDRSNPDGSNGA